MRMYVLLTCPCNACWFCFSTCAYRLLNPLPLQSRFDILKIHSRKMNLMRGIDLKKIAEKMNGASGAELKVCLIYTLTLTSDELCSTSHFYCCEVSLPVHLLRQEIIFRRLSSHSTELSFMHAYKYRLESSESMIISICVADASRSSVCYSQKSSISFFCQWN